MKKTRRTKGARALACVLILSLAVSVLSGCGGSNVYAKETKIIDLRTDGVENPVGIDNAAPRFSWKMKSGKIGIRQIAYQIVVKEEDGNTVWDSGRVKNAESADIRYGGEKLEPKTRYKWTVKVEDEEENIYTSKPAYFETALMDETLASWDNANWIGPDETAFDAASSVYFHIRTEVQMDKNSGKASLIFGANDERLKDPYRNAEHMAGEHYFRVELDVSQMKNGKGAALRIYRVGYQKTDRKDTPLFSVSAASVKAANLDRIFTQKNRFSAHQLDLQVSQGKMQIWIDGQAVILSDQGNKMILDLTSSYGIYPYLNSVGFYADPGGKAVYKNYQICNTGYGTGVLFDENTGAGIRIFDGNEGVSVEGNVITVDGGKNGILCCADPSFGASPMLRKEFHVKENIEKARLYISARGIYEAKINGKRTDDSWYQPGNAEYREEMPYQTYDITELVKEGDNAIGVCLGRGWWSGYLSPKEENHDYYGEVNALLAKIEIQYADGTKDTIVSDPSWQYYGDGPLRSDSFYHGVRYDAGKEKQVLGFSKAEYENAELRSAKVIDVRKEFSDYKMKARCAGAVHKVGQKKVKKALGESREGSRSYIYDMGENIAGVPSITIPKEYADEGSVITVRYAEMLYPDTEEYKERDLDGLLMRENYRTALSTDIYTMSDEELVIEPHFTLHGGRYIEITGLKKELPKDYIRMLVLSSGELTARYESSDQLVNLLFQNIQNSQTSNFISYPTDCPQRDERLGWLGDAQIYAKAASYQGDVYEFYRRWLDTVRAEQAENGELPAYAPSYDKIEDGTVRLGSDAEWDGIVWKSAIAVIPYTLYLQTGRKEIVEENIEAMYRYIKYLDSVDFRYANANKVIQTEKALPGKTGFLADWLGRVETDETLINHAYYVYMLKIASEMAGIAGQKEMESELCSMHELAKNAWNTIYIDEKNGMTRGADGKIQNTQASYAVPLSLNVISEKTAQKAAENLDRLIKEPQPGKEGEGGEILPYTLTTGFAGTSNLVKALSKYGYADTANRLLQSKDYASWLYPVVLGATSIWERFDSYTEETGFGNNHMNSFNHYALGAVFEWMMEYQLGICADKKNPGYKKFILQPSAGGTFTSAKGSFQSPYGEIVSGWTAEDGKIHTYEAVIPPNTSAVLYLPVEKAVDADSIKGAIFQEMAEWNGQKCAKIFLEAGSYQFKINGNRIKTEYLKTS